MRNFIWALALALLLVPAIGAEPPQQGTGMDLSWAFPVADKVLPPSDDDGGLKRIPGSTKAYTQAQFDDLFNPPDWFPDEHPPMPPVVQHGSGPSVPACASCHLMSGNGHPESSSLTGFPVAYLMHQLADFKSGARIDPARMNGIGKALSEDDARQACEWFAALKPGAWIRVVETDTVPKTFVNKVRMRLPLPGGGTEPLGNRIMEFPEDPSRAPRRDPHSGFIAYVPMGSVAKGETLVTTGGSGKTIACAICHGQSLKGLGEVPRISGLSTLYVVRQLYGFQTGTRAGTLAGLMKAAVAQLNQDDMVAIAAYLASREP